MQLGPSGTCRPDVYAMAHSYSKFCPIVYEVKVSMSDFRADVTAGKYTKYFKYAGGVVFAVPEGLLKKSDIPDGCGLMVRKESGWHTLKGPTMRQIDNLPRDAWIKLLMDGMTREVERTQIKSRSYGSWFVERNLSKKHGEDVSRLVAQACMAKDRLESEIKFAEERAKTVRQESIDEQKRREDNRRREEERLTDAQRDLAVLLGVDPDSPRHLLARALESAVTRLTENEEISRMRRIFGSMQRELNRGLELLPGERTEGDAA
ncbi:MmcB family DNA repair protein [Klebsiella michiganensis]|uniref:MmcB family DNA repair protein n=1 Tax=Klebsiella michiganensis TaxID=1134687 RepID=UPI00226B1988|nr:MmcB family DNA repair protein [Klebsiella michiganensis]